MNFDAINIDRLYREPHPKFIRNLVERYTHCQRYDGVVLDSSFCEFLASGALCANDVSEVAMPSVAWVGPESLASRCMANEWDQRGALLEIKDKDLVSAAAYGYLTSKTENRLVCDVMDGEIYTPAFGLVRLSYYRVIFPVMTLTGMPCIYMNAYPIGSLRELFEPETQCLLLH